MDRSLLLIILSLITFSCKEKIKQEAPSLQTPEPLTFSGEVQEPLIYFISKDSLIGVKDSKGRIVIPARGRWIYDLNDGDTVEQGFIHLFELDDTLGFVWSTTPRSFGKIYNRTGKFLYKPCMYDNGPDKINEGLTRFVENGKIGFVDRHANVVIPARFEGVGSFELGTALFCTGGLYDTTEDKEHPILKGAVYGIIDRSGKVLLDNILYDTSIYFWKKLRSLHQQFYSGEFRYTEFERKLIAKFNPYKKAIERKYFSNWSGFIDPKWLKFDITERPSPGFPYYVIDITEVVGKDISRGDQLKFYISAHGKNIFNYSWDGQMIPFSKWYKEYMDDQ